MNNSEIIILVGDTSNFLKIQEFISKYPSSKVYSLNYQSHIFLLEKNISHEIAEKFLNEEDFSKIDLFVKNTCTNWYKIKTLNNCLSFFDINLGHLLELELHHYFLPIYTNAVNIDNIISMLNPRLIISSSVLNDYVKQICESKKIKFESVTKIEKNSLVLDTLNIKLNILKIPISIRISRKTFSMIKRQLENFVDLFLGKIPNSTFKKSILLIDFNPVMYDELLKSLSKLNKSIILLNTRRPAVWNLSSLKILLKYNCKVTSLSKFKKSIKNSEILEQKKFFNDYEQLWGKNDDLKNFFSIGLFSIWPSIENSFKKITLKRFSELITVIFQIESLLTSIKPSLIIEWSETAQEEKIVIQLAKKMKIKTVYLQHAMAAMEENSKNMGYFMSHLAWPFLSEKQIVWGEPTKEYANLHKNFDVLVAGSPRHDKLFNHKDNYSRNNVILFAPTLPSAASSKKLTTLAIQNFYDFVQKTCEIVDSIPNKKLIVKPHPTPALIYNVEKLIKQVNPKIPITYGHDLIQILNECELVITTNNSTIAIDAMMMKKPVISLQTEESFLNEQIAKMNAVQSVSELSEIEPTIKKLLSNDELRKTLLNNSNSFLTHHFSNRGNASEKLTQILDTLSDNS